MRHHLNLILQHAAHHFATNPLTVNVVCRLWEYRNKLTLTAAAHDWFAVQVLKQLAVVCKHCKDSHSLALTDYVAHLQCAVHTWLV